MSALPWTVETYLALRNVATGEDHGSQVLGRWQFATEREANAWQEGQLRAGRMARVIGPATSGAEVVLPRDVAERIWTFMSRQSVYMDEGKDMDMLARCIAKAEPPQ